MSMQDPIADMLTRIRNAQQVGKRETTMPSSTLKVSIAKVLKAQGYIHDYEVDNKDLVKLKLVIKLKYFEGRPVIAFLKRASRPGLRIYKPTNALPYVQNGLGVAVISTSKGVMTAKEARAQSVGGEVLFYVA